MMSDHVLNNLTDSLTVTQPHFDDERTLLSARPVVPLKKIEAKARHRRGWLIGGAFALAMMLGAASALVASYFRLRKIPQPAAEYSSKPDVAPVALAANPASEPAMVTDEPLDQAENLEETPTLLPQKPETSPKHRVVTVKTNPGPNGHSVSPDEQQNRIRDAVLYDEWQERRARRALRRERRREGNYNQRNLSNLNEIFEGRRP